MRKSLRTIKNPSKAKEARRKLSIRKKVIGTAERPRVCATKSNSNLFVQVVDDFSGKTIFSVQTFGKNAVAKTANTEGAKAVGLEVAKLLENKNIKSAVFDRNGKKYTGVIATLADSIREGGIQI
ncbi:MAG: 50S ribosomal protein L18 [Bacteriovoracaceae bacterium]|jgi:large subunit ribosomal protein L18|nr:50S ribosomal protein L18 [Halobacteriovoraceae bacterium]MDP7321740.1 50S ribosomal protein L18 [Bacteriovoracaceae bacterium]